MRRAENLTVTDKALALAKQGLWVFPCNVKTKRPKTDHGHNDAVNEPAAVRALFDWAGDDTLIGVKCGQDSDILCIDFDLYKGPEVKAFYDDLVNKGLLPNTRIVYTRGGGIHVLYRGNGSGYPTVAFRSDGVDVKGDGGYCIWWQAHGCEADGEYTVAPSELVNYLSNYRRASTGDTIADLKRQIRDAENFHDALTRLAARLSGAGWTAAQVTKELLEAMEGSIAASPSHPRHARWKKLMEGAESEISRIINTGHHKYNSQAASEDFADTAQLDELRKMASKAGFRQPPNDDTQGGDNDARSSGKDKSRSIPLDEYTAMGWPFQDEGYFAHDDHDLLSQRYVMHPILCEEESVLLAAEPKSGKTAIALTVGLHIACGLDLGPSLRVSEPRSVLYFALEGRRAVRLRIAAWRRKMGELGKTIPDKIPLFVVERSKNLLLEVDRQNLANAIKAADLYSEKEYGFTLGALFIDTYTKAMPGGDQNSVEDTSSVFDVIPRIRELNVRAAVAFIHHKARAGHIRGSTNIEADPDVLTSVAKEGNVVTWKLDRARSVEEGATYHFKLHNYHLGANSQGFPINAPFVEAIDAEAPSTEDFDAAKSARQAMSLITSLGVGRHPLALVYDMLEKAGLAPRSTQRRGSGKLRFDNKRVQEYFENLIPDTGYVFNSMAIERVMTGGSIVAVLIR